MQMFDMQYEDMKNLRTEVDELRSRVAELDSSNLNLSKDDDRVHFYTGLQNYAVLMCIFNYASFNIKHSLIPNCPFSKNLCYLKYLLLYYMYMQLSLFNIDLYTIKSNDLGHSLSCSNPLHGGDGDDGRATVAQLSALQCSVLSGDSSVE